MPHKTHIFPYLLAGGLGTRLAPISTPEKPKQFLPLLSENSMIDETLVRLEGAGYAPATIITNIAHQNILSGYENVIYETERRGTAYAIQTAAKDALAKDENAKILILPCDHYIEDPRALHGAIDSATTDLTIFGVTPDAPETGYGYIKRGEAVLQELFAVESFTEKPDIETAQHYVDSGDYLWNSGIFLFRAAAIIAEIDRYAPDLENQNTSIDYAVLERSKNLHVTPLKTYWRDLGTQNALEAIKAKISA